MRNDRGTMTFDGRNNVKSPRRDALARRIPYENYLWHTPKPYSGNGLEVVENIQHVRASLKTLKEVALWHTQRKTRRNSKIAEAIENEMNNRK